MEMFHDLSVHASGISDQCLSYVERTQQLCGAFVRMQRDSVRSQLFLYAFIERFEMNEKVSFAFAHQQVRKENRIVFNVFATEIEQPRDFGNVVVEEISIYGFIVHIRGSCSRRLCDFQRLLDEFALQLSNDFDFLPRFFARPLSRMANNGTFSAAPGGLSKLRRRDRCLSWRNPIAPFRTVRCCKWHNPTPP